MGVDQPQKISDPRLYVAEMAAGAATRWLSNPPQAARSGRNAQIAAGVFLLIFGYWIGRDHCRLVLFGERSQGKLVSYKEQTFRDGTFTNTASMPVIEFRAGGQIIRFRDWMGSNFRVPMGGSVPILYDPVRPSNAMIDRPVANWIPWGPMMAVGLLLTTSGIRGRLRQR